MNRRGQYLSSFVIALLLISIPVIGFTLMYTMGGQEYGVTYDDTTEGLNQYSRLNSTIADMRTEVKNTTTSSGGFNIIGDYLGYGKNILFVTLTSVDMFTTMSDTAYENVAQSTTNSDASSVISVIRYIIIAIVLVTVLFIIIAALMGRNKL